MQRQTPTERPPRRRSRNREEVATTALKEETRHAITAVVLFVIAGISLLSFFKLAGVFGKEVDHVEGMIFGWVRYILPIVLIALSAALLSHRKRTFHNVVYLGWFLLLIGLAGMFHLFYASSTALSQATAGNGGGYIGYGVAWPLMNVMGKVASFILLLALFIIGVLVTFNTSLAALAQKSSFLGAIFRKIYSVGGMFKKQPAEQVWESQPADGEVPGFAARPIGAASAVPGTFAMPDRSAAEELTLPKPKRVSHIKTSLPLELLNDASTSPTSGDVKGNSIMIQKSLENFGISVEMGDVHVGPTVTQYTLKPAEGVKLSQIVTLQNDLALALAAHPIRIEAPIPGKSLVGVEVPNKATAVVSLREVLGSDDFKHRKSNLTVALGKDVAGNAATARLESMPHLLIAGATGSGKSVCINAILISLLYQNSPDQMKFILVDPKRVELTVYNDIPHLITPVITEVKKTVNALKWAVAEMDRRYRILSEVGVRNISSYNAVQGVDTLPYLVIIIDELADLMANTAKEVEGAIVRLAQMARAVGIHLIVATQRPSVDVITGLIKANITSRIAFSVASVIDSRTIIDGSGAEKLLGKGDMLYLSAELSKPRRLQGALVTDDEIQRVVNHLRSQAAPEYEETVVTTQSVHGGSSDDGSSEDDLYMEAKDIIMQAGKASASLLQRRLRVGYARAARLLDIMEEKGVIGPLDGARPREVLEQVQNTPGVETEDNFHPVTVPNEHDEEEQNV